MRSRPRPRRLRSWRPSTGHGGTEMVDRLVAAARPILTIALSSAVCRCAAVGSNYERPQMPTPPQYRFVEGTQAQTFADIAVVSGVRRSDVAGS